MNKHFHLLVIAALSYCLSANAQVYKKTTLQAGDNIAEHSSYLFPSFTDATVTFRNGGNLHAQMNFNLLIDEMQFIDPNKDTLVISNPENIDLIVLNNHTFLFNKGYYEILASAGNIKLAVLRKVSYQPVKIGALGLPNYTGSGTQSYTSFITRAGEKQLVVNEDVVLTNETACFLIVNETEFTKASKASFYKLFPANEEKIRIYLKQNKTDFGKAEDLEKLFKFCTAQQ